MLWVVYQLASFPDFHAPAFITSAGAQEPGNKASHTLPGKALNTYSEALSRIMVAPNSSHGYVYKDSTMYTNTNDKGHRGSARPAGQRGCMYFQKSLSVIMQRLAVEKQCLPRFSQQHHGSLVPKRLAFLQQSRLIHKQLASVLIPAYFPINKRPPQRVAPQQQTVKSTIASVWKYGSAYSFPEGDWQSWHVVYLCANCRQKSVALILDTQQQLVEQKLSTHSHS